LVVDLEGNSRPIEEIQEGDWVLARSEFDPQGPLELKRVEEKFVRTAAVMELVINGQTIKTTAEHPFYVPAQERFVPAGELQVGDLLVSSQGNLIPIESITSLNEITTVYNLRVADHHTYFVGGALWGWDVWVHNAYDPKILNFRTRHGLPSPEGIHQGTVAYARQAGAATGAFGVNPEMKVASRYKIGTRIFNLLKRMTGVDGSVLNHAENAALYNLWKQNGRNALGRVELLSDRPPCPYACQPNLGKLLDFYGIDQLVITAGRDSAGASRWLIRPGQKAIRLVDL
jgi:hypothetical protein